jgi:hypothetical protein
MCELTEISRSSGACTLPLSFCRISKISKIMDRESISMPESRTSGITASKLQLREKNET